MLVTILILAIIGFGISLYTYQLEQKVAQEPDYNPSCDINDRISCTKAIKSEYGNLFYFSNALIGMIFYVAVAIAALFDAQFIVLLLAIGGCLVSVVLAYLLYFKIKSLCVLCTSLYIINALLLLLSMRAQ
jgi:vitamin-K-epoxide reductase (warfarin-sensitive)